MTEDKIPFMIPLKQLENATPTLKNVFNKFSVRYFLSLGILQLNEEDKIVEVCSKPYEVIFHK